MKKLIATVFFTCSFLSLFAQDVHLSQFYTAQLNLNPALGGFYEGNYRVALNYRNQWREINDPVTTTMVAFDKKFFFYTDEIDAGILVIKDQFSGFKLNTNKIILSGSYKKVINYHELRGGIQMGIVMRSTDLTSQTFPNQWYYDKGIFDTNLDNQETTLSESSNYFDMNFGLAWSKRFGKVKPSAGISLFHINRPKATYFETQAENLRVRKVFHADADYRLNSNFSIEPKLMYMWTTKAQDMMFGSNFKYHFDKEKTVTNVYAGALYRAGFARNRDAAIMVLGFGIKQFDFGFSYDINVSQLSDYSDRKSTLEFSLIYTAPIFNPDNLSIPCDRY